MLKKAASIVILFLLSSGMVCYCWIARPDDVARADDRADTTAQRSLETRTPAEIKTAGVVTWKGSQDGRWSNPGNWEGGRVPGATDVARFAVESGSEGLVDANSSGMVAGLILEPEYHGKIRLKRDLSIINDLVIAGGTFIQGNFGLSLSRYRQTGGTFTGGDARLKIRYEATLSGGTLLSSKSMTARSLTIESPAVVTMAANSKLNLTGDGEPLNGNGLLDVTTNGPNSVEYTGRATADVTAAGPIQGVLGITGPANLQMPPQLPDLRGALGVDSPVRPLAPSLYEEL